MRYRWSIAVAFVYAILFGAFVAFVSLLGGESIGTAMFIALALLQVAAGFLLGWRAFLLLPLLVLFSIPVPVPEDAYEPMPLWFAMLYLGIPIAASLIALGMGARAVWSHWRADAMA